MANSNCKEACLVIHVHPSLSCVIIDSGVGDVVRAVSHPCSPHSTQPWVWHGIGPQLLSSFWSCAVEIESYDGLQRAELYTSPFLLPCNLACLKILIHLVYHCPSHLTEVRIKYSPTLPGGRQVQPSLTNEISAFMIHVKQTAPKISEATLLDLSGSRSACCQRSLMPPKANVIEVKLRDSSLPNMDPKCGTLFISPELLPLGCSWGEAH